MTVTNALLVAIICAIVGLFIGLCLAVCAFMIHVDLHYTDAEIEEMCEEIHIKRRKDR